MSVFQSKTLQFKTMEHLFFRFFNSFFYAFIFGKKIQIDIRIHSGLSTYNVHNDRMYGYVLTLDVYSTSKIQGNNFKVLLKKKPNTYQVSPKSKDLTCYKN